MPALPALSSAALDTALEHARLGIWQHFPATGICLLGGSFGRLIGLLDPELPATLDQWLERLHPDDRKGFSQHLEPHAQAGNPPLQLPLRVRDGKGAWRWYEVSGGYHPAEDDRGPSILLTWRSLDGDARARSKEALRKSEKMYRTLVETSPDAILVLSMKGHLHLANQQAQRLFVLDELRDANEYRLSDFLPADCPERDSLLAACTHPEEVMGLVVTRNQRLQTSTGRSFDAEISFTATVDDSGKPGSLVFFARDVTDKLRAAAQLMEHQTQLETRVQERTRALEEAHDTLAQILESSPVPTLVIDHEHMVTHWNGACTQMFGTPARSMIGTTNQWQAFYPEPRPILADLVIDGKLDHIDNYYSDKCRRSRIVDGAFEAEDYFPAFKRWLFFTAAPLRDRNGKIIAAIETLQDITERKMAEEYLVEAKQLAESAARTKAEFLANMSHEIRTPINAVIGLSHLLLNSEMSARQLDQISRIRGAGKMLLGLVNDILDFSKIEAGRMVLESTPFSLDDVLDEVATVILSQAQAKGLEVNYVVEDMVPPRLQGDPLRLTQVFVNLIGNAIKFTEQGGVTVTLRGKHLPEQIFLLEAEVTDSGIGMSPEQQSNLFQAFSQADTSITRKFGGTGLGLTICQRLVDLMQGDIRVTSAPGAGSSFCFTARLGEIAWTPEDSPFKNTRVLVVDDNKLARMVLSHLFQRMGCEVVTAASGEDALSLLTTAPAFDCITLDMRMPGLDGNVVAQAIRQTPNASQTPRLVLVTATDTASHEHAGQLAHFDDILNKPVTAAQIRRILSRLAPETASRYAPDAIPRTLQGLRVLLAEDIPTNQLIAREVMESFGLTVILANHGQEALAILEQQPVDLVVMDVQMPEMDGIEATRKIRAQARWLALPIIAMTAHAFDEEKKRCLAAGMNDFLTKPIDPVLLQATLLRWAPKNGTAQASDDHLANTAAASGKGMPALPGIDTVEGLRRMMGKPTLYERVLRDFLKRFADESHAITQDLAQGERSSAERRAHSLKGLAGSIGAAGLQEAALALQLAIRDELPEIPDTHALLTTRLKEVIDGLAAAYPDVLP